MSHVKKRSVLPVYLVGATWLVWAWLAPLHRPTHYVMAALVSAIVYFVGKMLFPDRGYDIQTQPASSPKEAQSKPKAESQAERPKAAHSPEIEALLKERNRAISEMHRLNDAILDPTISAQIDHMEATTGKIIDAVVEKPAKLPQIRRFMNYYLPTTLKLLNAYDRMDATGVSGANIDGTKDKIEHILDAICTAFDKQLDALYSEEAMDISTDIKVLENLLAQEGLGGLTFGSGQS